VSGAIVARALELDAGPAESLIRTCEGLLEAINTDTTPEKRCRAVCRQIARELKFPRCLFSTVDRARGRLVVRGAYDPSVTGPLYRVLTGLWTASLEPDAEGKFSVSAWCVEKREQIYVRDAAHYDFRPELTYQRDRVTRGLGVRGYVLTPIVVSGEAIGVLGVDTRGPADEVSADRRRMLELVAGLLGAVHDRLLRPASPMSDEPGETELASAASRDTELAVLAEGSQMQSLLDILDQGVLVVDGDDRVQYLNRATSRLLDILPWEAVGRPWREVLVLEKLEEFAVLLRECGTGPPAPGRRWTILRPAEGKIDAELKLLPLSSTFMGGARAVVMEDVSQRVELQRLRDEFTSMLVHDLKAPLQSIVGFAELLVTERLGTMNDDQKEFVTRIERSGEQMMHLIEGILDVARYESGRSLMRKERVPPSPLVEAIVQGLVGKALPARVEIRNTVGPDLPDLFADSLRLTQVFQNLIANAIHVSPLGGVIWVRGERTRDGAVPYVRFEVEDEGPGLSADQAAHMFDNLWTSGREDGAPLGDGPSSHGLGLVIARLIVEGHRGSIVAGNRPERGTAVAFTIPVYRSDR
jgi:signal transduction histidine kinase